MPITEVDGAPLAYDEDGQDTGRVPAALAERHRVIRYDLRGYGESTPPLPSFAHHDDLVALLDALGVDRAALVGCFFGGAVAVDAALVYPDRVAALVLLGAVVSGYRWAELEELWDRVVGEVDDEPAGPRRRGRAEPGGRAGAGAAHLLPLERPEPVAAAVTGFLAELPR